MKPGRHNALIDVAGLRVGHHTAVGKGFLTGTTVILAPDDGMVAGVDVRGGGPATRETDLLGPTASVERVHAIVLSGGSAFGTSTGTGVADQLAARRVGLRVGPHPDAVVPLVPGASLFDLGRGGSYTARPDAGFGAAALANALADIDIDIDAGAGADTGTGVPTPGRPRSGVAQGNVGAGTGAVAAGLKAGIGTASVVLPGGVTVAALAAVNAAGSPLDPRSGGLLGEPWLLPGDARDLPVPDEAARARLRAITSPDVTGFDFGSASTTPGRPALHTTLVVVATDATLTKVQCIKMAAVAQNGMARALNPVHTMDDGDIVFGVATAHGPVPDPPAFRQITVEAANAVSRAIVRAMLAAASVDTPAGQWPSWTDVVRGAP
jgi:putative pantetheine hydrolase